jgi:hypothetical protein
MSWRKRKPKPRPINYVIYAVLISIMFASNIFSAADKQGQSSVTWFLFIFAGFALGWNRQYWTLSRQPIKWKTPKLVDLIGVASGLLFFAAIVLFCIPLDEHFWYKYFSNNKPLMACLWGFFLLFPLREMLSKSDEPANNITEPNAAPNGGPGAQSGHSRVTAGPPSVS